MNWLLKKTINRIGKREQQRLDRSCLAPQVIQRDILMKWLSDNRWTQFGRDHRFSAIKNVDDFRQRVPLRDYSAIKPYIDAIIAGGDRILTRCPPFMFNLTSGTTGSPKFIPWNRHSDNAGSLLMRQWVHRSLCTHPGMLDHKVLCMVSPAVEGRADNDLPVGSASGRIYQRIPALVRRQYAMPYAVSEIKDYDQRYFVAIRLSIAEKVSMISTPNPSTLVRLAKVGNQKKEQIIRAIHDGKLGVNLTGVSKIQCALERGLRPNPAAARRLEKQVSASGALYPIDYWPDLKLIGCWTGGSVGTQLDKLPHYFGPGVPIRDLGYLASEGRMSLPICDHTSSGILAINTNFYEFIPENEIDNAGCTLLCDELEIGKRYYAVLTNASGLYRYDINDVIEVTGWYGNCPSVSFIRKGRDMTNITGEKIHVNHCILTMRKVADDFKLKIEQYRFVADDRSNTYHILVEPAESRPPPSICASLASVIDRALAQYNIEYDQKRRSGRLSAPQVHLMRFGWSAAEQRRAVINGSRDVEYKWRHLLPLDQCTDLAEVEAMAGRLRHIGAATGPDTKGFAPYPREMAP